MTATEKMVSKSLRYDFTENETKVNSKELARCNQQLVEAELKRKQIMTDLKSDEQRLTSDIARLSRWVNDGYDFRMIECRLVFNDPKDGIKSYYRLDTGELVESISMESHEMQENLPLEDPEDDSDEDEDENVDTSGNRRPY